MEYVNVTMSVPKVAYEVLEAVKNVGATVKACTADGWQAGSDLPIILSSAASVLVKTLIDFQQLPEAAKGDSYGVIKIALVEVIDILALFLKKPATN